MFARCVIGGNFRGPVILTFEPFTGYSWPGIIHTSCIFIRFFVFEFGAYTRQTDGQTEKRTICTPKPIMWLITTPDNKLQRQKLKNWNTNLLESFEMNSKNGRRAEYKRSFSCTAQPVIGKSSYTSK